MKRGRIEKMEKIQLIMAITIGVSMVVLGGVYYQTDGFRKHIKKNSNDSTKIVIVRYNLDKESKERGFKDGFDGICVEGVGR